MINLNNYTYGLPSEKELEITQKVWYNDVDSVFKRSKEEFITRDQFDKMIGAKVIE